MYGSIQVLIQAHKLPQVHFDTSYLFLSRINLRHDKRYDAYTRALLPGTRRNSKRVIWQPMVQELHATPYISIQMRVFLRPI